MYRAHAKATGGRDGRAVSSDNVLDVKLTVPREMGGGGEVGTNPEQLFAAGYSATTSIDGSVGIGQIPTGFGIEVELKISVPGLPREQVEALVHKAHVVCPYSNATRGNIDVKLVVA
jgi:organic hydroperoxide reductase OsmC/OhrA